MAKGTLQIHTDNILPIIKKWLYSDRDVFIRELVSNACDAMQKCKVLRDNKELDCTDDELRVDITLDKEKKTLTFSDSGIGLTEEEIVKYIAQIAFSGAEEFIEKYQGKQNTEAIIGHFGLGFYSAYMVAEKVTIDSLSYQEGAQPAFWECDGSTSYELSLGTRSKRGTTICLYLDSDSMEYLDENKVRTILNTYCAFLPFGIYLNGERINQEDPLWLKAPTECKEEEYKSFFHKLYPMEPDPIFSIHLNVDYPFHLKGILYFPKMNPRFDFNKSHVKLFCNRVFVSDNCKDLLPDYLVMLSGAIDSPDIPLNVSRSFLQMDKTVRQLSAHISKKIADKLLFIFETNKEAFLAAWSDIEIFIKLGILQDEKFYEKVKSLLLWKTTGGSFLTLDEAFLKAKEKGVSKLYYTTDEKTAGALQGLYQAKGIDILLANSYLDAAVMSFLESKNKELHFQRIDGGLDASLLSSDEVSQDYSNLIASVKDAIGDPLIEVEVKNLSSSQLPSVIVLEESSRRLRDYMAASDRSMAAFPSKKTFILNPSSPLVQHLIAIRDEEATLAQSLMKHLYEMALLSQKELHPKDLDGFIERGQALLERLSSKWMVSKEEAVK